MLLLFKCESKAIYLHVEIDELKIWLVVAVVRSRQNE